jgi:carboxymethylenebutenolidase
MDLRIPGHGGAEIAAVLERPAGAGPFPAVVLVHEIWGLTDHVRDLARRFAAEGFVALAPDLWSRDHGNGFPAGETDLVVLRAFVETIPDARMIGDLVAAAAHLKALPGIRHSAVGTVGFCMGGIYAFHLACETGDVAACVDFYGRLRYDRPSDIKPRGNLERVRDLRCPLLGIFGGMDHLVPLKDVLALKDSLGGRGAVIAYPRAGHAFLNDTRTTYRAEEAKDAWRRAILFLREKLAPDTLPPEAGPAVPEYRSGGPNKGGGPWKGGGKGGWKGGGKKKKDHRHRGR